MLRLSWRPAFFVLLVVVLAACSGASGCSGCSGCGITPLPAGFPQASVIPNAASVRLTRPGLDFISANVGPIAGDALGTTGGVITFDVPASSDNLTIATANICQSPSAGQCVADINVGGALLHVDSIAPANGPNMEPAIQISGTIPVKIADIPVGVEVLGLNLCSIDVEIGSGSCGSIGYAPVPVTAILPIIAETTPPRNGYAMVDTANATVTANIDTSIVNICGSLCADIADLLKSTLVSELTAPLQTTIKNELQTQLCTKPDTTVTPPCPDGTEVGDGGDCVFQTAPGTCVPTLLGLDGNMNLGSLVAKYSPGNTAAVDLVLAAAGAADPSPNCGPNTLWTDAGGCATDPSPPYTGHTPNGLTLGMIGGMLPDPQSTCVPVAANAIPQNIPIPAQLLTDPLAPWDADGGPDFDLALAGRFLNYAAGSAYNSGVLCLGVSTEDFQALSTGYVSAVVPSLKDMTFEPGKQSAPAAMAIVTRPQKPPTIAIGDGTDIVKDPLLNVTLPSFAIDFYVWSYDRYIRAFTYTADLTIPIDLQTGKDPTTNPNGGILPVLGTLTAANGVVTNSGLIWEDPTQLGSALSSLLGGIVGEFLGKGFSPINISSALAKYGIAITIPADGFRKLTSPLGDGGTDDFLALFANLTTMPTMMKQADTQASLGAIEVHPEAMTLQGADPARFPKIPLTLSSPGADDSMSVEYTYWIDAQPHAAWTTSPSVTVDSPYLFLQGKHVLHASARYVGHAESEDTTPAQVPFLIDVLAPVMSVDVSGSTITVNAYDYVSDTSALQARYRLTDADGNVGEWTAWQSLGSVASFDAGSASSAEVQVQDEAGNVGDTNQLIRGRPDPTLPSSSSSCGCSTPGGAQGPAGLAALAVLSIVGAVALRRRRAASAAVVVLGSVGVMAGATQGCSCGAKATAGGTAQTGCGDDCNQPCGSPNLYGLIGSYTSVAVATDGTVWVAGYDDADVTNGLLYGDLVAGKYDTGKQAVQWVDVDGLPPAPDAGCPPNDPSTWRGGLTDPGPDVGLWTSIQLDANNNPMITYYDATNQALKFASSQNGGQTWAVHTIMQAASSDVGRYGKMLLVDGKPTVAFLVVEPGTGGWAKSRVVLATANVALPAAATDWTTQDTVVDTQTPCMPEFCPTSEVCVISTMLCQAKVSGCTPSDCGASTAGIGSSPEACVTVAGADGGAAAPTCEDIADNTYISTYPDAVGDYVAMANGPQGLGIVVYDRTRGNLVGVVNQSGTWNAQILDGQIGANNDPTRVDTGDVGIGASIAIASNGDWNLSYVNGWTEALEYLLVPAGNVAKPGTPEIVDPGTGLNGTPYPDGQHIVGDDSSITVDSSGSIRIVYMDATAGNLLEATGAPGADDKHTWTVKVLSQTNLQDSEGGIEGTPGSSVNVFGGFFPHYLSQAQLVENWYRLTDHTQDPPVVSGNVGLVTP
jgi:MYXO-CTERM domain-containing protein